MLEQGIPCFGHLAKITFLENILVLEYYHFQDDLDKCISQHIFRIKKNIYSDFYKLLEICLLYGRLFLAPTENCTGLALRAQQWEP